jgi:hypothetical protein
MITKSDFKALINFSFLAILLFAIHFGLIHFFYRYFYAPDVLFVHPFLFVITIGSIISVKLIFKKTKLSALANAYMAASLGKMMLSLLFLLPQFLDNGFFRKEYVLQFFVVYFIYLISEVVYLVKEFKIS